MGAIAWTPAVREALNLAVINRFAAGALAAQERISGMLNICGIGTTAAENLVALILGKNFRLQRRDRDVDTRTKRAPNIYEQRARLGNYVDFLTVPRMDAIYDQIERIVATAETAGASAAEGPTRMVEAVVPVSLAIPCHTGQSFFAVDHPVKPGSSQTWSNLLDLGPLDFDSYDAAEAAFARIPDEDGHACNSRVRVLAVGPNYKAIGREIVLNTRPREYSGGDNPRVGDKVELMVVPDWGPEFWTLFETTLDSDRPYQFAEGRPLRVKPLHIDPEGAWETENNELLWAVDGDMAVVLGNPRRALMVVQSTAAPALQAIVDTYRAQFELNDFDFTLS